MQIENLCKMFRKLTPLSLIFSPTTNFLWKIIENITKRLECKPEMINRKDPKSLSRFIKNLRVHPKYFVSKSTIIETVSGHYAQRHYAQRHYAQGHYAQGHYAQCGHYAQM